MNALVNVPVCPLRKAPWDRSELLDEALYGMPVTLLGRPAAGWFLVRTHYGYTGCAFEKDLLPGDVRAAAWAEGPQKTVLHKQACDVLSKPEFQSPQLLTLPRGAVLRSDGGVCDGWQKVRLCDGREGYVRDGLLGEHLERPASGDEETMRGLLVRTALSYRGTQYRWGGKTPAGIDCSGLVFMAYLLCGVVIWRDAEIRAGYPVREIGPADVKRGDLLYFHGHVAMYLGHGAYLHSTGAAGDGGVTVNSLDPAAPDYRPDLAASLTKAGSIFSSKNRL